MNGINLNDEAKRTSVIYVYKQTRPEKFATISAHAQMLFFFTQHHYDLLFYIKMLNFKFI